MVPLYGRSRTQTASSCEGRRCPALSDQFGSPDLALALIHLCAPTYLQLREREHPPAELLGVAPVFADERTRGRPVYFCDVIVRRGSSAKSFWDLKDGA